MATIEDTRAIVDEGERFEGKIYPTARAEIDRPVTVHEDATVEGSVYGDTVELEAGGTIEGSVMASNAVELRDASVHREVGTPGAVDAVDAHLHGSVTATNVSLSNCVVLGSVVGTDVTIEDSVVIGIVAAERSLSVESSLCYTFESRGEATLADAQVLFPQAVADGELELATPVEIVGLQLTEPDSGEEATLTEADTRTQDGTQYLTLAPRLLNLEAVADRLATLEGHLDELAAGSDGVADAEAFLETLGVDADLDGE